MHPKLQRWHSFAALLLLVMMGLALWGNLQYAQPAVNLSGAEQTAQRIFYFHMGAVFAALLGFVLSLFGSILYLIRKNLAWDSLAASGIEVGLIGALGVLVTGSLWAKPTWNTYWIWDPRLTTTTVLVLVYVAYLLLRNGVANLRTRALFASFYAILAYLMVPLTYYSAIWFRSIHPMMFLSASNPEATGDFSASVGPTMRVALQGSVAAFVLLAGTLILLRWRMLRLEEAMHALLVTTRK